MRLVIHAAPAHTDEIGCVLEADIYRPDFDFTGVERLKASPGVEADLERAPTVRKQASPGQRPG